MYPFSHPVHAGIACLRRGLEVRSSTVGNMVWVWVCNDLK